MEIANFTLDLFDFVKAGILGAYVLAIVGLILLISPNALARFNKWLNKELLTFDKNKFTNKRIAGIVFFVISCIIIIFLNNIL